MDTLCILIVVAIVIFILWSGTARSRDYFGQDPSIRATAGWISGPKYGYDPITHFAEQIEEMKRENRIVAKSLGCHETCIKDGDACRECIQHGLKIAHHDWPLVGNPADEIGPSYKEGFCGACV